MKQVMGAEFKRFFADPAVWGPDTYWDDGTICVNNDPQASLEADSISDDAIVEIDGGELFRPPPGVPADLEDCFEWWRARQTGAFCVVHVPHDKREAFRAALVELGLEASIPV